MIDGQTVQKGVRAMVVPGSQSVKSKRKMKGWMKFLNLQALNGVNQVAACA